MGPDLVRAADGAIGIAAVDAEGMVVRASESWPHGHWPVGASLLSTFRGESRQRMEAVLRGDAEEFSIALPRGSRLSGLRIDSGFVAIHADVSRRIAELTLYSEVIANLGRMAASIGSIDIISDTTCRAMSEALRGALVRVVQVGIGAPRVRYRCGDGDAEARAGSNTHIGIALEADSPIVVEDFAVATSLADAPTCVAAGFRSGIVAPLHGVADQRSVLQVLSFEANAFGDAEEEFVRACANLLAAASERKSRESELVETRQELTALLDDNPDLIVRLDRDLRIHYANPAVMKVTGHPFADFVGRRIDQVGGDPLVATTWNEHFQRVVDTGREIAFETPGVISGRILNVRCVPERDAEGKVEWVLVVCRDMTDARRAEEEGRQLRLQLDQATRLASMGRLAAVVAHEFNNVLMAIQPFADLMQRRGTKLQDTVVLDAAHNIAQSIVRGRRITQEMLRYTRPVEPARVPVEVGPMMRHVVDTMRSAAGDRLRIELQPPPRDVRILADRTQIEQVFTNLITNARDAVGEGGELRIAIEEHPAGTTFPFGVIPRVEENLHFTFRDNGTGIPPARLSHIFEPLFTTKRGGTGLGLAVAHQVVSLHGGFIFVESQEGVGTAFHVFLPKTDAPAAVAAEAAPDRRDIGARRIGIIEDEKQIASGMSAVLEVEGFTVQYVTTGREATAMIEEFRPDVVLLDFGLPDIDGLEVYRRIRLRWATLPVIFSTGHADRARISEAAGDPKVAVLMKPYEIEQLFAVLAKMALSA